MHSIPSHILALQANSSALDDMLRLFGIASVIYAIFMGIKLLISKQPALPASASPQQSATPAPVPAHAVTNDGITPEIIAVIAAAVATVAGPACKVIAIKDANPAWENAGRQSVLTSHRIR